MLIDNELILKDVEQGLSEIDDIRKNKDIMGLFTKDFSLRFCWSSNAIEGNTLSLDDTVALIEDDEVSTGHKFSEYQKAKNLYHAISKNLIPFHEERITEEWIKENHRIIRGNGGEYRTGPVYVGSLAEVVFVPPEYHMVPDLMKKFLENVNFEETDLSLYMEKLAKSHFTFERIHPFSNGNGRVGRMILNQQMINNGLLPISINAKGKYRQSFRRYDKNCDTSQLIHEICKAELESIQRVRELERKLNQEFILEPKEALDRQICIASNQKKKGISNGNKQRERKNER